MCMKLQNKQEANQLLLSSPDGSPLCSGYLLHPLHSEPHAELGSPPLSWLMMENRGPDDHSQVISHPAAQAGLGLQLCLTSPRDYSVALLSGHDLRRWG